MPTASALAADVRRLLESGDRDAARDRFGALVTQQQRRAVRIAYHYLRDTHDADEAVQDAFLKVFLHIGSYRPEIPFEVWFTRILVNGCLDLRKARARRLRWTPPGSGGDSRDTDRLSPEPSAEQRLLSAERYARVAGAIEALPERQRTVFGLSQVAEMNARAIGQTLGLSEATVRVHLFRAVHKLRTLLESER